MIPDEVRASVEPITGPIRAVRPVGGGCIAHATRIDAERGTFFLKWAIGEAGRTFASEADGLRALRAATLGGGMIVPEPLSFASVDSGAGHLLMHWIEPGRPTRDAWRTFGSALAEMHRAEAPSGGSGAYGYEVDNWIGSKPQRNGWCATWPTFFGERRLRAQAATVGERGAWQRAWDRPLDRLIGHLPELLPERPPPSLVHGDLWSGNALPAETGVFAIVDPAVYVGHREVDLAMSELFGGFAPEFYGGYADAWPLEPGYSERREIYNLFHLINHLTHGPGYAGHVDTVLMRFGP